MKLHAVAAVVVGKLTLGALRLLGRRGNALPGLVVEKLFPRYLARALATLPEGVVVVTGTNGKTTTTKMVATLLGRRYRVLTNDTGSNFVRGAITASVEHARWTGSLPYDVAVFELDEAWAVRFVRQVAPRRSLLLNVMRDQLDRFGEIDTTAKLLGSVAAATTGDLVLNRDDARIAALAADTSAQVHYYGVSAELRELFPTDEELYGGPIVHSELPAEAELVGLPAGDDPHVRFRLGTHGGGPGHGEQAAGEAVEYQAVLQAQGPHNAQNAMGAVVVAASFGLDPTEILAGLAEVRPAFGRGQRFTVDGRSVELQLVKNPAGFRQSLRGLELAAGGAAPTVVIAINDDYADGRDVSWLWDVDFAGVGRHAAHVVTAGTRAADMATRLHYDDVHVEVVEPDLEGAVRTAVSRAGDGPVIVFSTYTAMWSLHASLERIGVAV